MARTLYARTTDQETAAAETALCDEHLTEPNMARHGTNTRGDVVGAYETTEAEGIACQVCGWSLFPDED